SPPPGSAAGFATSAPTCPTSPGRQKPIHPARGDRSGRRTRPKPPSTPWARLRNAHSRSKSTTPRSVKEQAKTHLCSLTPRGTIPSQAARSPTALHRATNVRVAVTVDLLSRERLQPTRNGRNSSPGKCQLLAIARVTAATIVVDRTQPASVPVHAAHSPA